MKVQAKYEVLKLKGKHQLLVYAYDVFMLDGSIHSIKKNTEALLVASKEIKLLFLKSGSIRWNILSLKVISAHHLTLSQL
jgi:hypothetical protein